MWITVEVWNPIGGGVAIVTLTNPPIRLFESNPWMTGQKQCGCFECKRVNLNESSSQQWGPREQLDREGTSVDYPQSA